MSYEGYDQHLCETGHLFTTDCYTSFQDAKCPCGKKSVFYNVVDQTNGEDWGFIPQEEWDKLKLQDEIKKQCDLGQWHTIQEATYRKPTLKEKADMQRYRRGGKWKRCNPPQK